MPNNYASILGKFGVDTYYHLMQDLLSVSGVGFALTNPHVVFGSNILEFWRMAQFDDGGEYGTPNIIFTHGGEEKIVTPQTVRAALHIPAHDNYTTFVRDNDMKRFLTLTGYEGFLAKL